METTETITEYLERLDRLEKEMEKKNEKMIEMKSMKKGILKKTPTFIRYYNGFLSSYQPDITTMNNFQDYKKKVRMEQKPMKKEDVFEFSSDGFEMDEEKNYSLHNHCHSGHTSYDGDHYKVESYDAQKKLEEELKKSSLYDSETTHTMDGIHKKKKKKKNKAISEQMISDVPRRIPDEHSAMILSEEELNKYFIDDFDRMSIEDEFYDYTDPLQTYKTSTEHHFVGAM
jgi:hypothetical protein